MNWLRGVLAHPATREVDLDSQECTEARNEIIRQNGYLRRIYEAWYDKVVGSIPEGDGGILEIGSGAGFFSDYFDSDDLITSDIIPLEGTDLTLDAQDLRQAFQPGSLRAITMVNVLHHLPHVRRFLNGAGQVLRQGGVVSLVEPWVSEWSSFIYRNLHHEPFEPARRDWNFESSGPLSGSNQALPWILFVRDRERFETEFPEFEIATIRPIMPFVYLLSGGVSMRPLQPEWMFDAWRTIEESLSPLSPALAMFAHIVIRKR